MQKAPNRCEVILQWIQKLIVEGNERTLIKIAPPILSRVYNQLGDGIVDLNNAVKIAEFPIPFPLAQMVTIMLIYHVFLTCTVCAYSIQTAFWASMFAFVIVFSFQSINYIACELEGPFGDDANDLPLALMARDMNTSLITLLADRAMTVPPTLNFGDMHRDLIAKSIDFDSELPTMAAGALKDRPGRDCKPRPRAKAEESEEDKQKRQEKIAQAIKDSMEQTDMESLECLTKPHKAAHAKGEKDSRARGQVAASQSASQEPDSQSSLKAGSTGRQQNRPTAPSPTGAQSAGRQGGQLPEVSAAAARSTAARERERSAELKPVTTQSVGRKDPIAPSAAAGSLTSGPPLSKPISTADPGSSASKKPPDKPAESEDRNTAALPQATKAEASRPLLQSSQASKAGEAPVDMAFKAAASKQVSGESETPRASPATLLATTESAEREERDEVRLTIEPQSAVKQSSPTQSAVKQSRQLQDLLPVATGSSGKEIVRAGMLAPTATQSSGREYGQIAPGLSAADEGAGGEREQRVALVPTTCASDYLSDWL